jgi:two-component system sensor histidine kinase RpfC
MAHPEKRHVPVIALTADATTEAQRLSAEAGMDAYLTKPIEAERLLQTIYTLVDAAARSTTTEPRSTTMRPTVVSSARQPRAATPAPSSPVHDLARHPRFQVVSEPPVDTSVLDDLLALGGERAFFEELIGDFVTDAAALIDDMREAGRTKQIGRYKDHAHALRSSAANVGALRLHRLLLSVRDLTGAEFEGRVTELTQAISDELERVRAFLLDYLSSTATAVRPGL